ncbi:hypothetical protein H9M94_02075 [Mycoplasma sp. Pen4]|uniref:hypothetical protein n=1 Tax=Mycoplasma sp. Pen4 TaxID=640330 RepID=UPI00165441A7|nr:hypothetical protein [Mycoplasma sp. Pen4]QNM93394.1 hypothetical protein H9M94_02075 [Mycoplasma sp. Pen4]
MQLNELKKLDSKELENIKPGFAWGTLFSAIPAVISGIGFLRSLFSSNGSVKSKDYEVKWDSSKSQGNSSVKSTTRIIENYILF